MQMVEEIEEDSWGVYMEDNIKTVDAYITFACQVIVGSRWQFNYLRIWYLDVSNDNV